MGKGFTNVYDGCTGLYWLVVFIICAAVVTATVVLAVTR